MVKYLTIRTTAGKVSYDFAEIKYMDIEEVHLENQLLTEDQYTYAEYGSTGVTINIIESDIEIEDNQVLKIGYKWTPKI